MGKTCDICNKRRADFNMIIKTSLYIDREMNLCGICYRKYNNLKNRYLIKAYDDLIEQTKRIHKND